ncbi:MAG TPA: amidohydrolase family protein [Acidimicrobiales bacterium]|nr:amidohydrolase family protein [Acidimicrobiales bacterium]
MTGKLWANSGDSHSLGERAVWDEILPGDLAARMPRSEKFDGYEIVHVDGKSFRRDLPKLETKKVGGKTIGELVSERGATDIAARLRDLDEEGVWAEVVYDSLGLWESMIEDPKLLQAANRAQNEWKAAEIVRRSNSRLVPTASIPLLDMKLAINELQHAASIGLKVVSMPTGVPTGMPDYNRDEWEPLWAAAEEAGMVLGFHIGSDNDGNSNTPFRGPGGAVLNYVQTTYGGQFTAMKLVTGGALDRHPNLKVLISEGGASWVPFIGDRMNEGYRQHSMFVRPVLSRLPKEILYRQVYTSFQHDESAPAAMWAMGYRNVLWGSDYPHLEGTFGHTQKTLHELFDRVDPEVSYRIRLGAFKELFPHVGDPPQE